MSQSSEEEARSIDVRIQAEELADEKPKDDEGASHFGTMISLSSHAIAPLNASA